jgi:hypothetical protein
MNPKRSQSFHKSQRAWTDLVFELYIEGSLSPLSAGEVCRSIDWIASHPSQLERIELSSPEELRSGLIARVNDGARAQKQRAFVDRKVEDAPS